MLAAVGTRDSTLHSSPLLGIRIGSRPRRHLSSSRAVDSSKLLNNSALADVPKPQIESCSACVSPLRDALTDITSVPTSASACKIRIEPFDNFYEVDEELGRGKFAVVRRCKRTQADPASSSIATSNNSHCAAKILRRRRVGKDCRADIMHEVGVLEAVRGHPHFVQLVEVFESARDIVIVTEFAAGGELFRYIESDERLGEATVVTMMRQVVEGLAFLHDRNIVHMDVKPQNILLTDKPPTGKVKICDLGLARYVQAGDDVREIMGTPDYVAPEILQYEPITAASDMWSVGVLTYVLLTGFSPFAGDSKQETFCNIGLAHVDFPEDLFTDVSSTAVDFIAKLLLRQPGERMTAQQCLAHPWLQAKVSSSSSSLSPPAVVMNLPVPHMSASLPQIGSPAGTRRALTPSSDLSLNGEPLKKSRCDDDEEDDCHAAEVKGHEGSLKVTVTLSIELQQEAGNHCQVEVMHAANIDSCKLTSDDDVEVKIGSETRVQHKSSVSMVVEDKTNCFYA